MQQHGENFISKIDFIVEQADTIFQSTAFRQLPWVLRLIWFHNFVARLEKSSTLNAELRATEWDLARRGEKGESIARK